jgi:hypothetical protein
MPSEMPSRGPTGIEVDRTACSRPASAGGQIQRHADVPQSAHVSMATLSNAQSGLAATRGVAAAAAANGGTTRTGHL